MELCAGFFAEPLDPFVVGLDGGAWGFLLCESFAYWTGLAELARHFYSLEENLGVWL